MGYISVKWLGPFWAWSFTLCPPDFFQETSASLFLLHLWMCFALCRMLQTYDSVKLHLLLVQKKSVKNNEEKTCGTWYLFYCFVHDCVTYLYTVDGNCQEIKAVFCIVIYVHFSLFHDKILQDPKILTTYITFKAYICFLCYSFIILKMLTQGLLEYFFKSSHSAVHTWLRLVVVKNIPGL